MYGLSTIVTGGIVYSIKSISKVDRPDGSANNSFPSGHTTSAFAAAEFLHQEYKHRSPIYSILGYAAATTTGILRMYNNKHYLSDVIAGAGFGILSTKLVYFAYPIIKGKITGRKSLQSQHGMVVP
jgi:membrane-associated phospholipid phosphatase